MLAELGDLLLDLLTALGTLTIEALEFLGKLFMYSLDLPLGLGRLPTWVVILGAAAIGVGLAWLTDRPMADRVNIVMAIVTVAGLGFGVWQWRSQVDRDELRRHADFVSRVAVVTYAVPEGLRVTVRNANSAMASVVFLSLARGTRAPENWEINVEPCTQRSFTVTPRATWKPIVRKGGKDWSTGADPAEISFASLQDTYGIKDANGVSQVLIGGAASLSEPVSDCA
ncbi:hypothetical protein [Nonomuraea sp. NPDC003709]|uniref:hypothetical protein n=1 Tax=Nonomuraea sp. NPDC003709 TaxID=3154450 RepID=UPI0033B93FA3